MKVRAIYHVSEWFCLCGGTGNVSCDIWPHHLELLAPSERTQDLSLLLSQHSDVTPSRTCESPPGEL